MYTHEDAFACIVNRDSPLWPDEYKVHTLDSTMHMESFEMGFYKYGYAKVMHALIFGEVDSFQKFDPYLRL